MLHDNVTNWTGKVTSSLLAAEDFPKAHAAEEKWPPEGGHCCG